MSHDDLNMENMNMRDWFAGQFCTSVVVGVMTNVEDTKNKNHSYACGIISQDIARASYEFADAMIAARGSRTKFESRVIKVMSDFWCDMCGYSVGEDLQEIPGCKNCKPARDLLRELKAKQS